MMRWATLLSLALLLILTPLALALDDWEATCIGNVLVRNRTIRIDSTTTTIEDNITCSYGCDSSRRECTDYSGPPGAAVPLALFIIFELIALTLLGISFVSDNAMFKLIASLLALILLFSLGLMATNIMVDGTAMQFDWLAWLNIGLAWVATIMFLASVFFVIREQTRGAAV